MLSLPSIEAMTAAAFSAPVSEAMVWLAPRFNWELPLPVASIVTVVRPLAVGKALVTFALSTPPLRM